ncbi:MAG: hypothetical protein M0R46_11915 [Candidatus Muirbacterium halophilum]|nr:hypothetical protein [Candidatus Muirbacterium halophilum]
MKKNLNYNFITYFSITFFFITLILISFSLKTGEPEIFNFIKDYSNALSEKTFILNSIFSKKSDALFTDNFKSSTEIRNISLNPRSFVTVECEKFDDDIDTYGFINIYSGSYKFTYPFKKIDINPINHDYTFTVKENVSNKYKANIFLNSGGSLNISAIKKIYIPSNENLNYSLHYSDISNFTEEYKYEKNKDYFFSGIDDFGIFTINYAAKNLDKFASKFRILDMNHHTVENINANLSALMIKWKTDGKAISEIDKIVSEKVSDFHKEELNTKNLENLIPRATVIHEKPVTVYSHIRNLNLNGIFLFENVIFEESPVELTLSGFSTIGSIKKFRILRNIHLNDKNSLSNIMSFSKDEEDFLIKASKLSVFIYSNKTPTFSQKTELVGNLNVEDFNKEKIFSSLTIKPIENYTNQITLLTISPVINYFSGDF